jgi:hypothetical protein
VALTTLRKELCFYRAFSGHYVIGVVLTITIKEDVSLV